MALVRDMDALGSTGYASLPLSEFAPVKRQPFGASFFERLKPLEQQDFAPTTIRGKHAQVGSVVTWHLVGHLQTNKAAQAAALFDAVHSVEGERVARALAERRPAEREPLAALIEVELTGQPGRSGVTEDGAESLVRVVVGLPGIHLMGLMTIAPKVDAPEQARPAFIRLKHLRDRLEQACGWPLPELSMGMSDDFEVAVEEGATMVRIGRTIFSSAPAGRQAP